MNDGWYPAARRLPITTKEYWAPRRQTLVSICNHITDGNDSRDYLQNANNGSSVHFLIREEGGVGVVYQFMPVTWAAWGNGTWSEANPYMPAWVRALLPALRDGKDNINDYTVSIEHERKWPFTTTLPDSMKAATIELQTWMCREYPSIVVDRDHIIGHYQVDNIRRPNCPGGPGGALFPFDDIISAIKAGTTQPTTDPLLFPQTGQYVGHGFLAYWQEHQYIGLPLTGEFAQVLEDGNTYTTQLFERGLLQYRPGDAVQEARVGYMWGKLRGVI
jgi:N-acetylmuramoyl-L-alanine amidase